MDVDDLKVTFALPDEDLPPFDVPLRRLSRGTTTRRLPDIPLPASGGSRRSRCCPSSSSRRCVGRSTSASGVRLRGDHPLPRPHARRERRARRAAARRARRADRRRAPPLRERSSRSSVRGHPCSRWSWRRSRPSAASTTRSTSASSRASCAGTSASACTRSSSCSGSACSGVTSAVVWYAAPFVVVGAPLSLYHWFVERVPSFAEGSSCSVVAPCSAPWFEKLGFVTLAWMAMSAFLLIGGAAPCHARSPFDRSQRKASPRVACPLAAGRPRSGPSTAPALPGAGARPLLAVAAVVCLAAAPGAARAASSTSSAARRSPSPARS